MTPFASRTVSDAFVNCPPHLRIRLLELRELVFATAADMRGVGTVDETLKWNEPAYRARDGRGTTVRIGWSKAGDACALHFHCKTTLVDTFRTLFGNELRFAGNRSIMLDNAANLPRKTLAICIAAALSYGRRDMRASKQGRLP
jgi:hypothetical protein